MARKRTTGTDSTAAAAPAPAREKRPVATRAKHAPANVAPVAKTEEVQPVVNVPETAAAAPAPAATTPYVPVQNEIAALAYSYWIARGYQGGSSEEDWLRAETELRARGPVQA